MNPNLGYGNGKTVIIDSEWIILTERGRLSPSDFFKTAYKFSINCKPSSMLEKSQQLSCDEFQQTFP